MSDDQTNTVIGIVVGGFISFTVAWAFHLLASCSTRKQAKAQEKLLKAQVSRLAELTNTLGRALHSTGHIDARFDAEGTMIGVNHHVDINEEISVEAAMEGRVVHRPHIP
ncbi:hypothetical protein ACXU40_08600 [Bordetella bronchiseptica]|uniref:hypothetical protein n=1 Tax=Bordetella bronchiseptica TaxID=518 RepID=UPI00126801BC|nr:hypothetical protein [Bordetella bronchiseptica]